MSRGQATSVIFVLPADVDDPSMPSGGNVYDRRVCLGLAAAGRPVREIAAHGTWPRPGASACAELAQALAGVPDSSVVLLDGLIACGVPEVVVPEADRLNLVVVVHLPLADEAGLAPEVAADLDARERWTLHAARAVVATSAWTANRLAEHHGVPPRRVHVVSPGTDPAPLAPGTDGVSRLLCVGSLTPSKGQDLLVEALAAVGDLPWTCDLVGPWRRDPAFVERLRETVARRGLDGRVRLTGPRTPKALDRSYAAADLVVVPSRAETFGMVVTEALARGIPVLGAAAQGLPDTLGRAPDGSVPGVLVPPGDVPALVTALREWFADEQLRQRLTISARQRRGMLVTWDETSRRLARLLGQLTS
ncbi:glycosyltransferase family 4 protein [Amycolatopsis taiwanensis]|uniref:glycosyltransferase family 4 protein n=1 Tax=Amycolatopsis taiwanensis TaxID=342230 RepID=UPI000482FA9A|nr:glycosyltransferase family 4 protein [Amycolatopsis taiwanensis]